MTLAHLPAIFVSAACMALLTSASAKAEERLIVRRDTGQMVSSLAYPRLGHARVDAALASFAAQELERRGQELERECDPATPGHGELVHLEGSYTLFRPSSRAVSVLFALNATGPCGLAPRRYFSARSYRLPTGEELTLAKVFENVPKALDIFAKQCPPRLLAKMLEQHTQKCLEILWFLRTRLIAPGYPMPDGADIAEFSKRDGEGPAMRLLKGVVRGTRAEAANYKHLVLTPEGVRIQFEPLQLGGPETEAPYVDLSLKELREAKPYWELWGK